MTRWLSARAAGWTAAGLSLTAVAGLAVAMLARGPDAASASTKPRGVSNARPSDARPLLVRVVRPRRKDLERKTTQAAHVEAYEKVDVYAKASGYVKELGLVRGPDGTERDLDIGDRVTAGDVLAELHVPEMEQDVRQKQALVEQARAEEGQADAALEAAGAMVATADAKVEQTRADLGRLSADLGYRKGEYERYQRLLAERTTSKDQVEERLKQYQSAAAGLEAGQKALATARANLAVEKAHQTKARADVTGARARLEVARANREQAKVLLGYAKVRAPFAGVVTRRMVDTGAFVQSASTRQAGPLFTVLRVDRLRILTDIPETDSPWIQIGQPATLRVDAARGRLFKGKVVRYADALDSATRTLRVEVELDKLDPALRVGLYGTVTITLAKYPKALMLPTNALLTVDEKPAVMVVEGKVAQARPIKLGINDGIEMQVLDGLSPDDRVITDGKDAVRDGQPVEVAK
jgi:RND family efflux transporter MFP subunit